MDNVDCPRGVDVLDECDFNGWGVHNCGHDADIGLICLQGICLVLSLFLCLKLTVSSLTLLL